MPAIILCSFALFLFILFGKAAPAAEKILAAPAKAGYAEIGWADGCARVLRGGAWNNNRDNAVSSYRNNKCRGSARVLSETGLPGPVGMNPPLRFLAWILVKKPPSQRRCFCSPIRPLGTRFAA